MKKNNLTEIIGFIVFVVISFIFDQLQTMYSGNMRSNLLLNIGLFVIIYQILKKKKAVSENQIFPIALASVIVVSQLVASAILLFLASFRLDTELIGFLFSMFIMVFFAILYLVFIIKQKRIPSFISVTILCILYVSETVYRLMNTGSGVISTLMFSILLAYAAANTIRKRYLIDKNPIEIENSNGTDMISQKYINETGSILTETNSLINNDIVEMTPTEQIANKRHNKKKMSFSKIIIPMILLVSISMGTFVYNDYLSFSEGKELLEEKKYEEAKEKLGQVKLFDASKETNYLNSVLESVRAFEQAEFMFITKNYDEALKKYNIVEYDSALIKKALDRKNEIYGILEDRKIQMKNQKIIENVSNFEIIDHVTTDELVKQYISNNDNIHTVYGWEIIPIWNLSFIYPDQKRPNEYEYLVAFMFDYDGDKENGRRGYFFEYNYSTNIVREVSGNKTLEEKWREFGGIE